MVIVTHEMADACYEFHPVGVFHGSAARKYDAPRQGAFDGGREGVVELLPAQNFETALRGLDGFERAWLLFVFDRNAGAWRPTTRPPVDVPGLRRVGVLASRAPYRPNPIGLSCVRIVRVEGRRLHVAEADLLDGTPVLDIKPYLPAADAFPDARAGWTVGAGGAPWAIDETPLFREQAARILAWQGPDLAATARMQLAIDPFDATRRRVRRTAEGGTLALRMFRIDFTADETTRTVRLERIRSGYTAAELDDPADPHADKGLHRRFVDGGDKP